jgi:putative membrane protein
MRQGLSRILPAVMLGVTVVACGGDDTTKAQPPAATTPNPQAREGVAGTAGVSAAADFVRAQLTLGEKQVGLARLASERATRPAVKQFAEELVRDHQQAGDSLRQIAAKQSVTTTTTAEQLGVERERLSQLSGAQFEREYLDETIADHERAIADLEKATSSEDAAVRQWATATLPIQRRHLEQAQALRKSAT